MRHLPLPTFAPLREASRFGPMVRRAHLCAWLACALASPALRAQSVEHTLKRFGIDPAQASVWVGSESRKTPLLAHLADTPRNPASVMKLVTTAAALDSLGPEFTWKTQLFANGAVQNGVLKGNLVIRGAGDPKLVVERLEPMMQAVRQAGIARIEGDIVLDRSAIEVPAMDPAEFDGAAHRPYNARPDALLINFKALVMTFTPDTAAGVARVRVEPPLAGVATPSTVPLGKGGCNDWRSALRADLANPNIVKFAGSFPAACPELVWPVAYREPSTHSERALAAMWAQVGGELSGKTRAAHPSELARNAKPLVVSESLPYRQIMQDVNKFSNNVMAQHVFLALGQFSANGSAPPTGTTTLAGARLAANHWWQSRLPNSTLPVFDNGSGLSRQERATANSIKDLLQLMSAHPQAATFFDSLPLAGMDGTLGALTGTRMEGRARLKTGTLQDATALAGQVLDANGQALVFVALYNGTQPAVARRAFYCLLEQVSLSPQGASSASAQTHSMAPSAAAAPPNTKATSLCN